MYYSRKKLDLTGQKYGRLEVLAPAENIGTHTAWLCRCDCGQETVVATARLRDGRRTSCGCDNPHSGDPLSVIGRASLTYVDGTCIEMLAAKTVRRNNTSGVPGVEWMKRKRKWRASICFKGKRYYLGSYRYFEDAVKARKQLEIELHDKFVNEYTARSDDLAVDSNI